MRRFGIICASGRKSAITFVLSDIDFLEMDGKFCDLTTFRIIFRHIFTAHAQKQQFLSFRLQLWQRHWIQRPRFPIRRGYFGNRSAFSIPFLHFFPRNPPYFYFRSEWPNFLKSGTRVALVKWINITKFEVDPTILYRDMTPLPQIRYVTLWPWRFTFWPWTVLGNFLSRDLTLHQIWASYDHPFLSYDVHTLTAIGNCACAVSRDLFVRGWY